jgi:crotonobetaine/carnitine-CoA ligase
VKEAAVTAHREDMLPNRIMSHAREHPDQVAVQEIAGPQWTYTEFADGILRWSRAYAAHGIAPGETVATMLPNGGMAFLAWLGAGWHRAVEVPLNTAYRGHMLRYTLNFSAARLLVISEEYLPQLAEVAGELDHLQDVVLIPAQESGMTGEIDLPFPIISPTDFLAAGTTDSAQEDTAGPDPHDVACMIYTSGTTGPSKGVLVPWRELYQWPATYPRDIVAPGEGVYSVFPVFHLSGRNMLSIAVENLARVVVRRVFSVREFWREIIEYGCTSTALLGTMAMLLQQDPEPVGAHPLRDVFMAPVVPQVDAFRERFGVTVCTGYGLSETGGPIFFTPRAEASGSCGRLQPDFEVRIVGDHDAQVPPGATGEVIVRAAEPWMMNCGYWQMPQETATAWRNGWFHTGDGMRCDDQGNFFFVDRIKDAIRRRGENISSFEVEGYVNAHPEVAECAAIAVPSPLTEDDVMIVVVRTPSSQLAPGALSDYLDERMPKFMLPRYIRFVEVLPKTPTLRVKKADLRANAVVGEAWDREAAWPTGS